MPLVMSNALADAIFWVAVASCTVAQVAILRSIFNTALEGAPAAAPGAPRIHRAMEIVWAILLFILARLFYNQAIKVLRIAGG